MQNNFCLFTFNKKNHQHKVLMILNLNTLIYIEFHPFSKLRCCMLQLLKSKEISVSLKIKEIILQESKIHHIIAHFSNIQLLNIQFLKFALVIVIFLIIQFSNITFSEFKYSSNHIVLVSLELGNKSHSHVINHFSKESLYCSNIINIDFLG